MNGCENLFEWYSICRMSWKMCLRLILSQRKSQDSKRGRDGRVCAYMRIGWHLSLHAWEELAQCVSESVCVCMEYQNIWPPQMMSTLCQYFSCVVWEQLIGPTDHWSPIAHFCATSSIFPTSSNTDKRLSDCLHAFGQLTILPHKTQRNAEWRFRCENGNSIWSEGTLRQSSAKHLERCLNLSNQTKWRMTIDGCYTPVVWPNRTFGQK